MTIYLQADWMRTFLRSLRSLKFLDDDHFSLLSEAHGNDKPKDIVCDICGNRYRKEAGLRQHMASAHSAFREFQCMTCGKGFTTQHRLTQHSRIHTGIKPFKCVSCEYKSNRADNVLFHLRKVHKVDRPTKEDHIIIQEDLLEDTYEHIALKKVLEDQSCTTTTILAPVIIGEITT